ncbi:MAG: anaerobic ribonucleoside-triphosphate reductase activating protein [Lachnospiraceae bacterium]|nr:anaerobic ribonucleoside-triphosphate reductase activating protein [Lachnospiraceae bacterium]
MFISGFHKTTLLDYPGCIAATIFTGGCNFRCPFCHNSGLVQDPFKEGMVPEDEVLAFLDKRKKILKGVCITGGEPTLQPDLPDFIGKVRKMGYRVKLDTNGYRPEVLRELLESGLLDYAAMDIKNCPEKYGAAAGLILSGNAGGFELGKIEESIKLLLDGQIDYEFRTTVVKELHTVEDIAAIGAWVKGTPAYYLQKFEDSGHIIGEGYHEPDPEILQDMVQALSGIPELKGKVHLRGVS